MVNRGVAAALAALVSCGIFSCAASRSTPAPAPVQSPAPPAPAPSSSIVKHRLPSGATLLYQRVPGAKTAAIQLWMRCGSACEPARPGGLTHVLERWWSGNDDSSGPAALANRLGGRMTSWTTLDHVFIETRVASAGAQPVLQALLERLAAEPPGSDNLRRIHARINAGEGKASLRSGAAMLTAQLMALAWGEHPYGRPVLGDPAATQPPAAEPADNLARTLSLPHNLVFSIEGDLDIAPLEAAINGWRPGAAAGAAAAAPDFPLPHGPLADVRGSLRPDTGIAIGFRTPPLEHADTPALHLLALLMGGGPDPLIKRRLVQYEGVAGSVRVEPFTGKHGGLFIVRAEMGAAGADENIRALSREIFRYRTYLFQQDRLNQAIAAWERTTALRQEEPGGRAGSAGYWESIGGDPDGQERYREKLRALKPEDLRRAAATWFVSARMFAAVQTPRSGADGSPDMNSGQVLEWIDAGARLADQGASAFRMAQSDHVNGVARRVLPNGATLLVQRSPGGGAVSLDVMFSGGTRYETAASSGIHELMVRAANAQIGARSGRFSPVPRGGAPAAAAGRHFFGLRGRFTARDWESGLQWMLEWLLNPVYDAGAVNSAREALLDHLRGRQTNLAAIAEDAFLRIRYASHPWRFPVTGLESAVSRLQADDLLAFHTRHYGTGNLIITLAGDVDVERATLIALESSPRTPPRQPPPAWPATGAETASPLDLRIPHDLPGAYVITGAAGASVADARSRAALSILAEALEDGAGPLWTALRKRNVTARNVRAVNFAGAQEGFFAVYVQCSPNDAAPAAQAIREAFDSLGKDEAAGPWLTDHKKRLRGRELILLESPAARAAAITLSEIHKLEPGALLRDADLIETITEAEASRAAREYLAADRIISVIAAPAARPVNGPDDPDDPPDEPGDKP